MTNQLPHPIKITLLPDGGVRVRRISWRTYDRLNPRTAWSLDPITGRLVGTPVRSQSAANPRRS